MLLMTLIQKRIKRVTIFSEKIRSELDDPDIIGCMIVYDPEDLYSWVIMLKTREGDNYIHPCKTFLHYIGNFCHVEKSLPDNVYDAVNDYLSHWYGVQQALLNPITQEEMIKNPQKYGVIDYMSNGRVITKDGQLKRVYVRQTKYEFNKYNMEKLHKRKIKCPYWPVIGHWRHYKSGKIIFIKPYWKGPKRQKAIDMEIEFNTHSRFVVINKDKFKEPINEGDRLEKY